MRDPLLVALAGLFIAILIARLLRGIAVDRKLSAGDSTPPVFADPELKVLMQELQDGQNPRDVLRRIERRALSCDSAEARAAYHCAAGHLSLDKLKRPKLAVHFFLRALREDPTADGALKRLQEILVAQKRFKRLEDTYWHMLSRLDDAEVGSKTWLNCWSGLASIYSMSPRYIYRADAIRKALRTYYAEEDTEESELSSD